MRAGDPATPATVEEMLRGGDRGEAYPAVLVAGRLRDARYAAALASAASRPALDDEVHALAIRALVLCAAPQSAEIVVRAMAEDRLPPGRPVSQAVEVGSALGEAPAAFRDAVAPLLMRALGGEYGPPAGVGLVELLRSVGLCGRPGAAAAVTPFLDPADADVRRAAAETLGLVAGPETEKDLRAAWFRHREDAAMRGVLETAILRAHLRSVSD